ncbi:50S ribosomal protein L21 [candidate division WOR-1 bacterium RIFOXYB2_FULL_42_35]|uniref:Large ribosomal subunit protein bL21 n=1 Tax=candidate division WOR-1 bacterium RIFOXYC2_FULL_41_25 TaxID=1802586 RepID=A0A1F4TLB4_UNCSA|nr:MAG: 50S ribosomal protein L21 [candidate division WOR-1 bacterium RIFOXYA2_FULL_41_14]OGC23037.1 MAG: 50S ribosomal protein L21 [candidate division WOR-1 bacterium RIFOXYB2_FULL_42_35]OGC33495.1 MAG: 50S ribosomal protein L21 [candidate division WOR-1 bacterium RIFOXYC2_FULL_41_25]OGC44062.1 MAG: 50S ribosomal protein L21 [candidate division WOR-1 bacterium RIFOXYD2_FULL_41_8]
MYAIIETGGKQYKVEKGDIIEVELLDAEKSITFSEVLLVSDDGKVEIGTPYVKDAKVAATILGTGKDKKAVTFKYKNKTNYHRTKGHRQPFTRLQIEEITNGA